MKPEVCAACDQILTAVLNGSCQGILVALLAGLGLRLLGRTNATTRHAVWFATLLLLAFLVPAHYRAPRLAPNPPSPFSFAGDEGRGTPPSRREGGSDEGKMLEAGQVRHSPLVTSAFAARQPPSRRSGALARRGGGSAAPARRRRPSPLDTGAARAALPLQSPEERPPWRTERFLNPVSRDLAVLPRIPRSAGLWLLALWLAVAGIKLTLLARGLYQLRKLKDTSVRASPGLEDLFQRLRSELAVKRTVRLKVSQSHRSAILLGFVHPVIVLPAEAAQESGLWQTGHILRHELAHARRRDDWTNLAQRLIQAALFFHPAVWWISKQLSLEREIACDDSVLQQGVRPQPYALLLANLASRMTGPLPVVAPGASSSKSQLQQRITMILNTHRNRSPRLAKAKLGFITSAAALTAVLALYSGPRLVLAQTQPPTPAPATTAPATPTDSVAALPQAPQAPPPAFVPPPPVAPPAPVAPQQGGSIEERLDRLERMVEKLLAQQGPKRPRPDLESTAPEARDDAFTPKDTELIKERVKREVARATDQALREVARATEQAKRAFEQAKPALEQAKRSYEQAERNAKQAAFNWLKDERNESARDSDLAEVNQQLEALQSQRTALELQLQKLNRQIQRLQKGRGPTAEDPFRSQNKPGQPKPEETPPETPAAR